MMPNKFAKFATFAVLTARGAFTRRPLARRYKYDVKLLFLISLLTMQIACVSKSSVHNNLNGVWVAQRSMNIYGPCKGLAYGVSLKVVDNGLCEIQIEPNMCVWGRVPKGPTNCSIKYLDNKEYMISDLQSGDQYMASEKGNGKLLITRSNELRFPLETLGSQIEYMFIRVGKR